MSATIATVISAGSFFDLNRPDPRFDALRSAGAEPCLPFALMERILRDGPEYATHAGALTVENIVVAGTSLAWYDGDLHPGISAEINLGAYRIAEHTAQRREALTAALERLANVHPDGFTRLRRFVRGFLWVELLPSTQATSLTSSSDPALPYVIMFSDKARHHIPPNTVLPHASPVFLAENLLHESVHQSISFHLLRNKVFTPDYSSRTSPKIEIRWRAGQGVQRNQWWEVDRAFHATCVYNQLMRFRRTELGQDDLPAQIRAGIQAAHDAGLEATRYLMSQLEEHDQHFTAHGRELLADLRTQTDEL